MQWLVKKVRKRPIYVLDGLSNPVLQGNTLKESQPVVIPCVYHSPVKDGPLQSYSIDVHVYDGDRANPPFYPNHAGESIYAPRSNRLLTAADMKVLAPLRADLSSIATTAIPTEFGQDGKKYYTLNFEIRATFYSASTKYALWHRGICYGAVSAEYA